MPIHTSASSRPFNPAIRRLASSANVLLQPGKPSLWHLLDILANRQEPANAVMEQLMPDHSDRPNSSPNGIPEQINLPAKDYSVGTPYIVCPSRVIRQAFEDRERGLIARAIKYLLCNIKRLFRR